MGVWSGIVRENGMRDWYFHDCRFRDCRVDSIRGVALGLGVPPVQAACGDDRVTASCTHDHVWL